MPNFHGRSNIEGCIYWIYMTSPWTVSPGSRSMTCVTQCDLLKCVKKKLCVILDWRSRWNEIAFKIFYFLVCVCCVCVCTGLVPIKRAKLISPWFPCLAHYSLWWVRRTVKNGLSTLCVSAIISESMKRACRTISVEHEVGMVCAC